MDLFDEKTLTNEQKFMLMLNDKLDRLIDEVNELKININPIIPKEHKLMKCPDNKMYANTAFIRIHLKNKEAKIEFLEYIKTLDLETDNFYIDFTKDLLVKSLHDNSCEDYWTYLWASKDIPDENITIQGIVQFTKIKLVSDIGNSICNRFENDIIVHNGGCYGGGLYIEPLENGRSKYVQLYYLYYINTGNQKKNIVYVPWQYGDMIDIGELETWKDVEMPADTPSMEDIQIKIEDCWFINDIIYSETTYLGVSSNKHHHPLLKSMAVVGYENE